MADPTSAVAVPRLTFAKVCEEPFRIFFPAAALAGLVGVLLWPLHFAGWVEWYPGVNHARIMAHGFFGGFILGFLGTALPRMLGAPRLGAASVIPLWLLHAAMVTCHALALNRAGDLCFLALLGVAFVVFGRRVQLRRDVPPPGFLLVPLGLLCGAVGTGLWLPDDARLEDAFFWLNLRPLLAYQGFVLLPILGVAGFILPRFFGLSSRHDFAESVTPPPGWTRAAVQAGIAGLAVLGSFALEASGHRPAGLALRCLTAATVLFHDVPVWRAKVAGSTVARVLLVALALLPLGFGVAGGFPTHRVALLHFTLGGGFALLTLCVATRVVCGHSGQGARLSGRWHAFTLAAVLMGLGLVTRISGDYWPKILPTHYSYGGLLFALGLLVWIVQVLPGVRRPDPDG